MLAVTHENAPLQRRVAIPGKKSMREPDFPLAYVPTQTLSDVSSALSDEPVLGKIDATWNVRIPVFEWEIDPTDTGRRCGSAELKYLGWEFRMWWEKHSAGLVYASIQATEGGRERDWQGGWEFPPDRILSVNLVYDEQRQGIISINGTARDLRPFVEAFLMGFGIGPSF